MKIRMVYNPNYFNNAFAWALDKLLQSWDGFGSGKVLGRKWFQWLYKIKLGKYWMYKVSKARYKEKKGTEVSMADFRAEWKGVRKEAISQGLLPESPHTRFQTSLPTLTSFLFWPLSNPAPFTGQFPLFKDVLEKTKEEKVNVECSKVSGF